VMLYQLSHVRMHPTGFHQPARHHSTSSTEVVEAMMRAGDRDCTLRLPLGKGVFCY
jgi:hypothetical protein